MDFEENRGFTGLWIPAHIVLDENLSISDKMIYAYIASFAKCCWQSNEQIASRTGVSERSVTSSLKKLAENQYIFVEFVKNNNAKRRIFVIVDNPKKIQFLAKKGAFAESSKNCEPSDGGSKICETSSKNCETTIRGESSKICDHRIKNTNRIKQSDDFLADESPKPSSENDKIDTDGKCVISKEQFDEVRAKLGFRPYQPSEEGRESENNYAKTRNYFRNATDSNDGRDELVGSATSTPALA